MECMWKFRVYMEALRCMSRFGVDMETLKSVWRFGVCVGILRCEWRFGVYVRAWGCIWGLWGSCGMFGVYMEALGGVWRLWGVCEVLEHTQKAPPAIPSTQGSDMRGMSGWRSGKGNFEGIFCGTELKALPHHPGVNPRKPLGREVPAEPGSIRGSLAWGCRAGAGPAGARNPCGHALGCGEGRRQPLCSAAEPEDPEGFSICFPS